MRKFTRNRPPYLLWRLISLGLLLIFSACATTGTDNTVPNEPVPGKNQAAETGIVVFTNKTPFTVHLVRGSGRTEAVAIAPDSSVEISNTYREAEIYYPLFDIPLTVSFSLSRMSPKDRNFYYQTDNQKQYQEMEIRVPGALGDTSAYIVFTNNSKGGGVSISRNQSNNLMTGINFPDAKSNINEGETMVFGENPLGLFNMRINPLNIRFGEMTYRSGFVYTFVFDGTTVSLTDARPLQRIGESAWAKTIPNVTEPMPLAVTDAEINLFASTEQDIIRYVFDSAGNVKAQVKSGDSFIIGAAARAGDGFLVAGYEELANGDSRPAARIHGADGITRCMFEPSGDYRNARFFNAAQGKDDTVWLLAGDGTKDDTHGNLAYAALVQDKGGKLTALWEIGGDDFNGNCLYIESAVYDPAINSWLVTGANNEFDSMKNPVKGSFIAEINNSGTIQKIDNSFKGLSFHKILTDSSGACYLAGEEQKGNETYAVLFKCNINTRQFQRVSIQPPQSHSYYNAAFFDSTENRVVLAGVLQANDEYGQGGLPFIEAVDAETGTLQWREILSDPSFSGASLVTAIAPAPDYGFVVTLSGMAKNCEKPFLIARLNSQGKLLKE